MEIDTDFAKNLLGVFWYAILWIRLFFFGLVCSLGADFFCENFKKQILFISGISS